MSNMLPNETPIIIEMTPEGKDGLDGVSVVGFGMVSQEGKVKTYRFTLSNGEHFDFSVADGEDPVLEWGNITGTLTDQTDLAEALTAIRAAIASKAEASDVYDKATIDSLLSAIDAAIGQKANADAVYTKTEADALLAGKADTGDSYTKSEDDALLAQKANSADVYTKTDVDAEIDDIDSAIADIGTALTSKADASDLTALENRVSADEQTIASKADASSVYTKTEADALLAQKADTADVTTALASKADADDLADAVADIADLDLAKASVIVNTASGAMVSIEDGAEAPVKALTVGIEPVQDLHGYDSPWPGGGGKNLCYIEDFTTTVNGLTFTAVDNILTINGTSTGSIGANNAVWKHIRFNILVEGSYVRSVDNSLPSGFVMASYALSDNTPYASVVSTYPIGEYYIGIYIPANTTVNNIKIQFQIESGSAVTSFAPYANICPITGHTQAVVTRTGKNVMYSLLNYPSGYATDVGGQHVRIQGSLGEGYTALFRCKAGQTYTISGMQGKRNRFIVGFFGDTEPKHGEKTYDWINTPISSTTSVVTFTAKTTGYAACYFYLTSVDPDPSTPFDTSNIQIELGSTATPYEPYQGQTISVTFPSEAGTVYGGYVDVTNRTLTVDRGIVYLKDLTWTLNVSAHAFNSSIADRKTGNALNPKNISNTYRLYGSNVLANYPSGFAMGNNTSLYVKDDLATTIEEAVALFTQDNTYVIYTLATPLTYTLTPQQMTLLLGQNNIWADTGDVTIEYRADTKLYIQALTKPTEDNMVANANIASGQFFSIGNSLYLSSQAIAQGETIVVGTNCTAVGIADALNMLNS